MRLFIFGTLAVSLVGCAATQLNPGAERVLVTRAPAPNGCVFVGSIVGEQGGAVTGAWTSNKNLAEGAFNDMKNKARDINANYVVLENSNAGNTISGGKSGISGGQTDVTHMGNAYRCPEGTAPGPAPAAAASAPPTVPPAAAPVASPPASAPTPAAAVAPAASAKPKAP